MSRIAKTLAFLGLLAATAVVLAQDGPYDHSSLLAQPDLTEAVAGKTPGESAFDPDSDLASYDLNHLPVTYDSVGNLRVAQQPAVRLSSPADSEGIATKLNESTRAVYVVGGIDLVTYYFIELDMPYYVTDADGGTIRLILQHESQVHDQVRVIDAHIGMEYDSDFFGRRGRYPGRYGWARFSGGGESAFVLGDVSPHNLAYPWNWAWILDYRWLQGNTVLGGDRIRIYSHPHVTTRVIFID